MKGEAVTIHGATVGCRCRRISAECVANLSDIGLGDGIMMVVKATSLTISTWTKHT